MRVTNSILGTVITFMIFAGLGALIATRLSLPVRLMTWILLAVGIVVGAYVGVHASLVSVFGVGIYVNWAIQSWCIGTLFVLIVRTVARRRLLKDMA